MDDLFLGDIFYDFDMPETEPDFNVLTSGTFIENSPLSFPSRSSHLNGSESISDPPDLISSTYNGDHSTSDLGFHSDLSTSLAWHEQDSPDSQSQFLFCDAPSGDSSMLGTALQGRNEGHLEPQSNPNSTNKASDSMIELRRVLSYQQPMSTTTTSSPSPSSTSTSAPGYGGEIYYYQVHQHNNEAYYYELKVNDPMLSNYSVMAVDDANMPNVEEVIQPRIVLNADPGTVTFYNADQTQRKKLEMVSERKVSSTTVGTEWTCATPNSNGQPTPAERPMNQLPSTEPAHSTPSRTLSQGGNSEPSVTTNSSSSSGGSDMPGLPNSSNGGATSRKERSLHYCNNCNKGFKDKYSVNVHIRTHTGEKPFACTLCGKTFRQKAHLAKHHQTHAAKASGKTRKGSMKKTIAEI